MLPKGAIANFLTTLGTSFFNPSGGLLPAFSRLDEKQLIQVGFIYGLFSSLCFVASYFMTGLRSEMSIWQLFLIGIVPFTSFALTGFIVRVFWHHRGDFGSDIFIAGVTLAPIAFSSILIGFVSISLWSLIIPLALFGFCYSVSTLQASYIQLLNLTEAKASIIVALMFTINSYITYLFFTGAIA